MDQFTRNNIFNTLISFLGNDANLLNSLNIEPRSYVVNIEKATLDNNFFRKVLFTGKHLQLVVMSLKPLEEIGNEMHSNIDQFFRIESGTAQFIFNDIEEHMAHDGDAIVVPAGTYHNIINPSTKEPLKLYTLYSPPQHPQGTIHKTKTESMNT